jgi:RNase P/RNase MRP subunit p30
MTWKKSNHIKQTYHLTETHGINEYFFIWEIESEMLDSQAEKLGFTKKLVSLKFEGIELHNSDLCRILKLIDIFKSEGGIL